MYKVQIKSLLNKVYKDYKKGIEINELEQKYSIKIDNTIEDYFSWIIKFKYQGKIEGLKKKDYKIQEEIHFFIMENMEIAWIEVKIYNYIDSNFQYITVYEI